jgi:hypothetical protein
MIQQWKRKKENMQKIGANFINILLAPFLYKSVLAAFLYLHFGFVFFFGARLLEKKLFVKC